jgi:hypothetical protein
MRIRDSKGRPPSPGMLAMADQEFAELTKAMNENVESARRALDSVEGLSELELTVIAWHTLQGALAAQTDPLARLNTLGLMTGRLVVMFAKERNEARYRRQGGDG